MTNHKPAARGAIVEDEHWESALQKALDQTRGISPDVAILFASGRYAERFPELVQHAQQATGAPILIGCSGQGIIGTGKELEEVPALALLALALPGAILRPVRFTQRLIESWETPEDWREQLGVPLDEVNAWLVFADPFHLDCEQLIDGMTGAYPGVPMLGGLASTDLPVHQTFVFLNDKVYNRGGVGLAIGGPYSILPLVSQGCEPIGEPWTITDAQGNFVYTISNRMAYEMLVETISNLPPDVQQRAQGNLLVGLAADEYRDSFGRGSFLIRQLIGLDRRNGALVIGATARTGQTIQFQMRDADTADLDLYELLAQARADLGEKQPIAGILCSCNGRGTGLFGIPDHDAGAIAQQLGPLPLAGLFCNGEIGPIGKRPFLHGFTASLALLVQT